MATTNVVWIHVFKGKDDQWYFDGRARNGQIVTSSEGYTRKSSAVRAARKVFGTTIGFRFD